jgi:hypothetical protein
MHASLWRFRGDPDELLRAYDALAAELPLENFRFHACLRAPDGMIIVDTCPSKEVFENFVRGSFEEARKRHGLPEPEQLEDFPVSQKGRSSRRNPAAGRWTATSTSLPQGFPYQLAARLCRDEQWPRFGCLEERGDEHRRLRSGVVGAVDVTVARIDKRLSCRERPLVARARRDVGKGAGHDVHDDRPPVTVPGELGARLHRVLDVDRTGRVVDVDHHRASVVQLELEFHVDLVGEDRACGERLGHDRRRGSSAADGMTLTAEAAANIKSTVPRMSMTRLLRLLPLIIVLTPFSMGWLSAAPSRIAWLRLPTDTGRIDARNPQLPRLRWRQARAQEAAFPPKGCWAT